MRYLSIGVALAVAATPSVADESPGEEIDRTVWSVVSETVAVHDLEGMAAVYHQDAVVVSERGTVAIADQLVRWGEGMERAEAAGASAGVSFRFVTRQDGETTAFQIGMFRYTRTDRDGTESTSYVPFEALLVKKEGRWLILMERQLKAADESAWDSL
jgi:uncharacterized protein (TIGR02246 family)